MTADFQCLSAEVTSVWPFSALPTLAECIEERCLGDYLPSGNPKLVPWLNQAGIDLHRIKMSSDQESARIRALADVLSKTAWQSTACVDVVPYLKGRPAGKPRSVHVAWIGERLYVENLSIAKLAKLVPEKLADEFSHDFYAMFSYCVDRTREEVTKYLEENFTLEPKEISHQPNTECSAGKPNDTVMTQEEALAKLGIPPPEPATHNFEPEPLGSGSSGGRSASGLEKDHRTFEYSDYHEGTDPNGTGEGFIKRKSGNRPFISYIGVHPGSEEPDPDGLDQSARMSLEEKAIDAILLSEPALKRTPTNNPGYDLFEAIPNGQVIKWVEVKAMSGSLQDRSVGMSHTQFELAQDKSEAYWLYIVENTGSETSRIVRIQNPASRESSFTFDHGWLSVAEAEHHCAPPEEGDEGK